MSAYGPRHYRYAVVCPDDRQRHSGTWADPEDAKRWADRPQCCSELGRHKVVQRRALPRRGGYT